MSIALVLGPVVSVVENNRIANLNPYGLSPEDEAFYQAWSEELARQDEQERNDRIADQVEAELYGRLERPRTRRQASLPTHHHKTWGHGNSHEMINWIGQFKKS
jgi:hypothetical protein